MTSRKLKRAGEREMSLVRGALGALARARASIALAERFLEQAGCPRALARAQAVTAAVKAARRSTEGAERHMNRRMNLEAYQRHMAELAELAELEASEGLWQRRMAFGTAADA